MVDLRCFTRVRSCRDDIATKTYENPKDPKSMKLVQYIISDELVHNEFNWKRLFLKRLSTREDLPFKLVFFREMRRGYIAYFRKGEHVYWQTALREMSPDEFRQYLLNLIAIFRAYEREGAIFTTQSPLSFAVSAQDPTQPVVVDFDDVHELMGEHYVSRQDLNVARQFGELIARADRSSLQYQFYRVRATSSWHAFSLLSIVCTLFREYSCLQEQKHGRDSTSRLNRVAEKLWAYDFKVLEAKSPKPSIDVIESILRGLSAP